LLTSTEGDGFLHYIIVTAETWAWSHKLEMKQQFNELCHLGVSFSETLPRIQYIKALLGVVSCSSTELVNTQSYHVFLEHCVDPVP